MNTLTRYIGETKPFTDVLQAERVDPVTGNVTLQPLILTGLVSAVRFMAQSADTGEIVVDQPAVIDEVAGDSSTVGAVHYTPSSGDVAAEDDWVQWWRMTMLADGSTQDSSENLIRIRPHGVAAATSATPTNVCQVWATNEDVFTYAQDASVDEDYTPYLVEASELLYALSARRFPGICTRTVRPMSSSACGCWGIQVLSRGHIVYPVMWEWLGGYWCAESDLVNSIGCGSQQQIHLSGYVQEVTDVKISGSVVDPTTYRVDRNEWLVRLTDLTTGQNPGWPMCQNITLPDDAPGTFSVTYTWGRTPPLAGVRAAATLAWQLYLNDNRKAGKCRLPAGWTSITRQGVTITRPQVQRLSTEGTGIVGIDAFLSTYNPNGLDREPAVYSRDVPPYAYRP